MKQRGVKNTHLLDLRDLNKLKGPFDTILLMFNNFGLSGSVAGTQKLLKNLQQITSPNGRIIATIVNPYKTDKIEHLNYHQRNQKAGHLAGLVKIRKEYRGMIGDWFKIILMSPDELGEIIAPTGWQIAKIFKDSGAMYGVILEKVTQSKIARRKHRH